MHTYVNSLSFLGMMSTIMLISLMFIIKRHEWLQNGTYNWEIFNEQLTIFLVFLAGPIITSFIAVFSIFYEYQQRTINNILTSPHGRVQVIAAKILYVSAFVVLQYAAVAAISVLCALALGFNITPALVLENSSRIMIAGLATIALVPLMMLITLLSRSFIPAMVISVIGTISNVLLLHWEKSYLSPWTIPSDMVLIISNKIDMNIIHPLISLGSYFILFIAIIIVYSKKADLSV